MQFELFAATPEDIDKEVENQRKQIKYWVVEPTVELHVKKLQEGDYHIPSYQRELTWEPDKKSKFIESILMGLPIPFITGVEVPEKEGSIAIVDGSQRLRSLAEFVENKFVLKGLEVLDVCNGIGYDQLPTSLRRKFNNHPIRMVLLDGADASTQFTLFERINTTGKQLSYAEIRRGAYPGLLTDLMIKLADEDYFTKLTSMSDQKVKEREREELVLRFFCYSEKYLEFRHDVRKFLDYFLREKNEEAQKDAAFLMEYESKFLTVCKFVAENLPDGFQSPGRNLVPRVRFESLAVGIHLALASGSVKVPTDLDWLDETSKESDFGMLTRTDASNSAPKMKARIEYVRDKFINV